jgi:Family of unknown function (DUF6491)
MTHRTLKFAALLSALAFAAAPSAARSPIEADPKPPRQCFWVQEVNGFAAADERFVNIRVGVKDVYQFEMFGRCHDIDWSREIALVTRNSSSICTGMDADIVTESVIGPQRCPVRSIRKLTAEEIAALPKRARP